MNFSTVFFVSLFISLGMAKIPEVIEFFPEIDNDLSRVTWGHAINSKELLEKAISGYSFMMLEADVSKGHLENETSSSKLIPIMAHPPHKISDISLEMWIDGVIKANEGGKKIGVKLDFKDLDIVITSLEILRKKSSQLSFPLWLNADILRGPGGEGRTPVDADIFLSLCTEFFPHATLSLGWTTEFTAGANQKYTNEMVEEMVETLERNNVNQPVTFPIRAAFVGQSMDALETLFIDKPEYTFTVWTSPTDDVSVQDLAKFQNGVGSGTVYFDLPEEQMDGVWESYEQILNPTNRSNEFPSCLLLCTIFCIFLSMFCAQFFR